MRSRLGRCPARPRAPASPRRGPPPRGPPPPGRSSFASLRDHYNRWAMSQGEERYHQERARIEQGHVKYREKLRAEGKLFVRERLKLLLDPGTELQEEWLFARSQEADTPADGVITGVGRVGGRTVCIMANDYTVKAGSWGEKTVLKIVRIQEKAARLQVPMLYLVDAAGVHPVRTLAGRLRLPAGADRPRHHGGRQGLALRGQPSHGGDGDRREDDAGGAGRRPHAHRGVRLRRRAGRVRRGSHRAGEALSRLHAIVVRGKAGRQSYGGRSQ